MPYRSLPFHNSTLHLDVIGDNPSYMVNVADVASGYTLARGSAVRRFNGNGLIHLNEMLPPHTMVRYTETAQDPQGIFRAYVYLGALVAATASHEVQAKLNEPFTAQPESAVAAQLLDDMHFAAPDMQGYRAAPAAQVREALGPLFAEQFRTVRWN